MKPRAHTKKEVREKLVKHFLSLADYWSQVKPSGPHNDTEKARMEGLVHSILVTFDGCSCEFPAFDISPAPHPDDEEYNKSQGENWYAKEVINDCSLHDLMWEFVNSREKTKNKS